MSTWLSYRLLLDGNGFANGRLNASASMFLLVSSSALAKLEVSSVRVLAAILSFVSIVLCGLYWTFPNRVLFKYSNQHNR